MIIYLLTVLVCPSPLFTFVCPARGRGCRVGLSIKAQLSYLVLALVTDSLRDSQGVEPAPKSWGPLKRRLYAALPFR